ncbi:DUF1330 domain-containing protein [Sphingobium aromaticivastans]|uniref:DUF1330 domain-containing protein n=1 Tax=Sphingobium aromaticivastans TaxID=1778665 RepID=UPI003015B598
MTAYVIFMRERTTDQTELDIYASMTPAAREGHSIRALHKYGRFEVREGDPVEGVVVLEFPTFEEAQAWYDSPKYQEAAAHRMKGSDYRMVIVDGID